MSQMTESRARQLVERRGERALKNGLIAGALTVPLVGFGLMLMVAAFFQWRTAKWLSQKGVLVRADRQKEYEDVGEDFASTYAGKGGFALLTGLLNWIGRYIPAVMRNFGIEHGDKQLSLAKYAFSNEEWVEGEDGRGWALIDPKHPRLRNWPVSELPE